jgi:hypothetical protein
VAPPRAPRKTKGKDDKPGVKARTARAVMAHHANRALARRIKVRLELGPTTAVAGWIVAITADHEPQLGEWEGRSTLLLHLVDEEPPRYCSAELIAAARKVPLEHVRAFKRAWVDGDA